MLRGLPFCWAGLVFLSALGRIFTSSFLGLLR